jgi:hypothetical protein
MKAYRQPLSEDFVYSSPERPVRGSYRWVTGQTPLKSAMRLTSREVRDEPKRRR